MDQKVVSPEEHLSQSDDQAIPGQPGLRQLLGASDSGSFNNVFGAYLALLDDEARAKAQRGEGSVAPADHAPLHLAEASIVGDTVSDAGAMVIAQASTNPQGGAAAAPPAGGAVTGAEAAAPALTGAQIGIMAGVGAIALAGGGGGGGGSDPVAATPSPAAPSSPPPPAPPPAEPPPPPAAPSTPTSSLTVTPASGKVVVGSETSDDSPTFSGTGGTAGDTVTLYVDGASAGTATVQGDGTFSVQPTAALADGARSVTYTFSNAGGESGQSAALALTVDTAAPNVTGASVGHMIDDAGLVTSNVLTSGSTDDLQPVLRGTLGTALASGETLELYRDGATTPLSVTPTFSNGGLTFEFAVTETGDGTHTYKVVAVDAVGNEAQVGADFTVTYAATAPTATAAIVSAIDDYDSIPNTVIGTLSTGAYTNDPTPTLNITVTGTLGSGETVAVFDGATYLGEATEVGPGTYTYDVTAFATDPHSFTAAVRTAEGVTGTASTAFDLTADADTMGGTGADILQAVNGGANLHGGNGDDILTGQAGIGNWFYSDLGADQINGNGSGPGIINYVRYDNSFAAGAGRLR